MLLELRQEGRVRFRCHVGHAYSLESLLASIIGAIDQDVETAIRSLEEGGLLMEDIARELTEVQELDGATRMTAAAQRVRRQSKAIRELMREPTLSTSAAD